jgi:hypothetical protein
VALPAFLFSGPLATGGEVVAPGIGSRILGRLFVPSDQYFSARDSISQYIASQQAWEKNPCLLPSPETLLELSSREWFLGSRLAENALRQHGIDIGPPQFTEFRAAAERRKLWNAVAVMRRTRPDPMWILDGWRRGLIPNEDDARRKMDLAGGSWDDLIALMPTLRDRPGIGAILGAWAEGRFNNDVADRYLTAAGTDIGLWTDARDWLEQPPAIGDIFEAYRRGILPDELKAKWLGWHRHTDADTVDLLERLSYRTPGISDLLRMGSRQLFSPEIAGRYGLYDGFQEASRPYFKQLGLDYPLDFQIPVDGVLRQATLPDLYWGATREILPLGSAYLAYQRLRASNIPRYRDELPNLREFSLDDLRLHMRVQGYPPPMQDYLIALSHPPLGRRDINWGIQYGGKDRDWAYSQYLNLGLRPDDAAQVADTQYVRATAGETRWLVSLQNQARRTTVSEIEGMYDEGILDRGQALSQLAATGMPDVLSVQILDLRDAKRARSLLRAAVTETGRDYLSGTLSAAEALAALGRFGIKEQRRGELMQIWSIRRSRRRRQADTSRVLKWIGEGRITVDDARRRLSNLGWTDPDLMLLLGEGEYKLAELRAKSEQAQARAAAQQAKELERLSREAEAERKRIRTEANRVAPRSTLTKWVQDGIITRDDFYALMRERGFPQEEIDRYYADATTPRPPRPRVVPAEAARARPAGSAHPAVAILQRWAGEAIIDRAAFTEGIRALGYGDEDVQRFVREQYEQST